MAVVPNKLAQLGSFQVSNQGTSYFLTAPIQELDGTPIDLSAWDQINLIIRTAPGTTNSVSGLTGGADGTILVALGASAVGANAKSGSYNAVMQARNLSTDPFQVLGFATIQYSDLVTG